MVVFVLCPGVFVVGNNILSYAVVDSICNACMLYRAIDSMVLV